jgi:ribosomal protein L29
MKRKDFAELKEKTKVELTKLVVQKRMDATKKKMEILAGKEKNLKAYKNLRQEIAKILTLVKEKEILEKLAPKVEAKEKKTEEVKIKKGKTVKK